MEWFWVWRHASFSCSARNQTNKQTNKNQTNKLFSFCFLILKQDDTKKVQNTVKYRLKPCHLLFKAGVRSRPATPLCFNGKVVQDHEAQSHRSVLPCVDRKREFFGSAVYGSPSTAMFLWPGYNAGRPGCMWSHFLNKPNAHKVNLLHELVCDKIFALVGIHFFGGTVSNANGRISSKDAAMVRIGRRESCSDQSCRQDGETSTRRTSHQRAVLWSALFTSKGTLQRVLPSCTWFQPTPANKTCVASDGESRREIRRAKLVLSWIARATHHLSYGNRGDVATRTCSQPAPAQSVHCLHFEFVLFTVHKWSRVWSANILLYGNGMINWTVYKLYDYRIQNVSLPIILFCSCCCYRKLQSQPWNIRRDNAQSVHLGDSLCVKSDAKSWLWYDCVNFSYSCCCDTMIQNTMQIFNGNG